MSDFQAIADRVEIEALRGEFTDAAMMRDRARLASLDKHRYTRRMGKLKEPLAPTVAKKSRAPSGMIGCCSTRRWLSSCSCWSV